MGEPGESTELPPMGPISLGVTMAIAGLVALLALIMIVKTPDGGVFWSFLLIFGASIFAVFNMIARYPFKAH